MLPATTARRFCHYFATTHNRLQDAEWAQEAKQALRATGYPPFRNVDVRFSDGVATIRGSVPTYYLKQLAQSVLINLECLRAVQNELNVI